MVSEDTLAQLRIRIGERVRALRQLRGWTQEKLATTSDLATRHVQKVEAGEVNVTLCTLWLLATALETDIVSLFSQPSSAAPQPRDPVPARD